MCKRKYQVGFKQRPKVLRPTWFPQGTRKQYQYEVAKRVPETIRKIRYNIAKWVIPKVNFEYGVDWKILDTSPIYFNSACAEHMKKYNYYYRTMYS